MNPRLPLAAITDEFSPSLEEALPAMKEIGMTGAELRMVEGKNILDLSDDELHAAKDRVDQAGLQIVSIASPLLKCVLEGGPELDRRFEHDVFASKHTAADQDRLADRAFEVAQQFGASIVRVFSYWRTVDPTKCQEKIARALDDLARKAHVEGLRIGLENEHACNVATGRETAAMLRLVDHPALGIVWDPANALVAGEEPYPAGYELLPKERILHVHAKDAALRSGVPEWGPLGTRQVRWKEQISALLNDRYCGYVSLETHWRLPGGNRLEASRICGWNLLGLTAE